MKKNLFSFPRSKVRMLKGSKGVWLFLIMFWMINTAASAAGIEIKGTVTDSKGEPLPGVNIVELGVKKNNGTISDLNGKYTITVESQKSVLNYTFIGYKTTEVTVGNRKTINVSLKDDTQSLDEVVVIGYGTMRKKDLSGAVASIKSDDLMLGNPTSISQALQGKLAGVQVNQSDGAPGSGVSITIRGANSFSTNSQPLYIVDGIPFEVGDTPSSKANEGNNSTTNPLSLINPNDIESIDILKDASATAIYGSRGANGVVLITTKRGRAGDAKVEFSANFGLSKIAKMVKMLDAYTYANYVNEGVINGAAYDNLPYSYLPYRGKWNYRRDENDKIVPNSGKYYASPEDYLNPGYREDEYGNKEWVEGTNWMDEILQDALTQEYNLSVSGGNEKSNYAFSGNYTDQTGIIKNSGYERFAVRANIGSHVKPWLNTGLNINFTRSLTKFAKSNSYDYSIIRSAMLYLPTLYVGDKTEDDSYAWLSANPRTYVNTAKDELKSINVFTSAFAEITILDCLKFRQNLGISYSVNDRASYYNRETGEGKASNGRAGKSDNFWQNLTAESLVTFDKTFNKLHHLNVVAGFTYEKSDWGGKTMNASNFPTDITQDFDMSQALNIETPASYRGQAVLVSLLGRANYTLKDRYIFTASFRRDGSSRFAPGNKFANFASGAVAWTISEEEFIKNLNIFSNLKLRFSYGQTGNQAISSYQTIASLAPSNYPLDGTLSSGFAGQTYKGPLNDKLKWETTDQYNVGLDMGFWNNRISLSANYYYKKTTDLLYNVAIPSASGYDSMLKNIGSVQNKGYELSIESDNLSGAFSWTTAFNISFNRNKVLELGGETYKDVGTYDDHLKTSDIRRLIVGQPIGVFYGYRFDGIFQNEAECAQQTSSPSPIGVGLRRYKDLNGDGKIDATNDREILGAANPKFFGGMTNTFAYKGFELNVFLQYSYGNKIFNYNAMELESPTGGQNVYQDLVNRWTPTNPSNEYQKATTNRNNIVSDRFIEDGSFLKLKTVSLSYSFPKLNWKHIGGLRLYVTGQNLLTWTKYRGYDPEVSYRGASTLEAGEDFGGYPQARTFMFGIKLDIK